MKSQTIDLIAFASRTAVMVLMAIGLAFSATLAVAMKTERDQALMSAQVIQAGFCPNAGNALIRRQPKTKSDLRGT